MRFRTWPAALLVCLAAVACGSAREAQPQALGDGAAIMNVGLLLRDDGLEVVWSGAGALAEADDDAPQVDALPWELRSGDRVVVRGTVADPRSGGGEALVRGALVPFARRPIAAALTVALPSAGGTFVLHADGLARTIVVASLADANGAAKDAGATPAKILDGGACPLLSVLVMPEGFTAAELGTFHARAEALVRGLVAVTGFTEPGRVEAYRADLASAQSGISDVGDRRTTAWDVHYGVAPDPRRAIAWTEPNARAFAAYGAALTAAKLSTKTALVVLVNSTEDLGSSNRGTRSVVLASSPDAPRALAHELGHVLARLADEYDYGECDLTRAGLAPNTTKDAASPPWRAILASPPVEGADLCARGVYRPQATCLMRDLDQDLCPVCHAKLDAFFATRAAAQPASCQPSCAIPAAAPLCLGDQDCAADELCVDGGGRFVCVRQAAGCRKIP